jgi:hypothetical protein
MRSMRIARMAGLGALAALLALAGTATAHVVKYKTGGVNIEYHTGSTTFSGKVSAGKHACQANRRVEVLSDAPGVDVVVGSARTNSTGEWAVNAANPAPSEYYADADRKTLKLTVDHRHVCTAVRSQSISAP